MKQLLSCLLFILLTACQPSRSDSKPMSNAINPIEITIQVGESADTFAQRNAGLLHLNVQPAGLTFYQIDRDPHQLATVQLAQKASLTIPYVLSVMGTLNTDYLSAGLEKFSLFAALTDQDTLSNEAVRVYINSLLQQFRAKGWQPLFYYDAPRLRGEEQFDYALADSEYSFQLDGEMDLSPHNWQRINWIASPTWMFYADNVFAKSIRPLPHLGGPQAARYRFADHRLQSMESYLREDIPEKDRANWRAFWPAKAKWYRDRRDSAEIPCTRGQAYRPALPGPALAPAPARPAESGAARGSHPPGPSTDQTSARVSLQRDALPAPPATPARAARKAVSGMPSFRRTASAIASRGMTCSAFLPRAA
jgi:hypothetical protein